MKTLLNTRLHPALILSSVLFWFIVVLITYAILAIYWIHKLFFTPDKNITTHEVGGSGTIVIVNRQIRKRFLRDYKIVK